MMSCGDQHLKDATAVEPTPAPVQEAAQAEESEQVETQEETAPAEAAEEPAPAPQAEEGCTVEGNGYSVKVNSAKAGSDWAGNPIILVECIFTNNGNSSEAFGDVVNYSATQNGNRLITEGEQVILDTSVLMPMRQEIGSGQSITVNVPFATSDFSSPVDVQISIVDANTTYASGGCTLTITQ